MHAQRSFVHHSSLLMRVCCCIFCICICFTTIGDGVIEVSELPLVAVPKTLDVQLSSELLVAAFRWVFKDS